MKRKLKKKKTNSQASKDEKEAAAASEKAIDEKEAAAAAAAAAEQAIIDCGVVLTQYIGPKLSRPDESSASAAAAVDLSEQSVNDVKEVNSVIENMLGKLSPSVDVGGMVLAAAISNQADNERLNQEQVKRFGNDDAAPAPAPAPAAKSETMSKKQRTDDINPASVSEGAEAIETVSDMSGGGKSRRKSRKNVKKTTRRNKKIVRKSSKNTKQQRSSRRSSRRHRSSRKSRK